MADDALRTAWTFICSAQQAGPEATLRRRCLEYLAETYREPVRAMMRAWGLRDDNQLDDRVQEYFTRFLEKNWLDQLDRDRGRLRGFLRTSVRNFLLVEKDRSIARRKHVDGSPAIDEEGVPVTPDGIDPATPDKAFDQAWAREVMRNALTRFYAHCDQRKLTHYRTAFERHILDPQRFGNPSQEETARQLNVTPKDVRNYVHRAKELFTSTVRAVIRETVNEDDEVDQELTELRRYLR
jgi:RNA polymerase sigma factor (sigma-70 family)